jgi:hypothetical protein
MDKIVQRAEHTRAHEACAVSNTGQQHNPLPPEALRIFAQTICPKRSRPSKSAR